LALENPVIDGQGVMGSRGAVIIGEDGVVRPNLHPNKSSPIENSDKYVDIE